MKRFETNVIQATCVFAARRGARRERAEGRQERSKGQTRNMRRVIKGGDKRGAEVEEGASWAPNVPARAAGHRILSGVGPWAAPLDRLAPAPCCCNIAVNGTNNTKNHMRELRRWTRAVVARIAHGTLMSLSLTKHNSIH